MPNILFPDSQIRVFVAFPACGGQNNLKSRSTYCPSPEPSNILHYLLMEKANKLSWDCFVKLVFRAATNKNFIIDSSADYFLRFAYKISETCSLVSCNLRRCCLMSNYYNVKKETQSNLKTKKLKIFDIFL